jgi:hypothetical protein
MKIVYENTITLKQNRINHNNWDIRTDLQDQWCVISAGGVGTPWGAWWEQQHQSELRRCQKDVAKEFRHIRDLTPYLIYKPKHGYSQPHDLFLAHSMKHNIWIFSTQEDFWIQHSTQSPVKFFLTDSLGSVLNAEDRMQMYRFSDRTQHAHSNNLAITP